MPAKKHIAPPTFEQFLHSLPGLYLVMTPDFYVVDASDEYVQASYLSREQLRGSYLFDVFPDDEAGNRQTRELKQSLQHVLEHKEPHTMPVIRYDVVDRSSPGSQARYWKSSNTPILDAGGNVSYILHETRDVTEQEQERSNSRQHLSLLSSAVSAVNWDSDLVSNVIYWGDGISEIFGYTPEAMGSGIESWALRIHPDDSQRVLQSMEDAKAAGKTEWSAEYRFRKASGTYAFVLDKAYITYNKQGQAVRTAGSMIDLSGQKQTELALKESNARLQQLVEALPYMAWTADPNGQVLYFNQNWYKYTGMPNGQTQGWVAYVHPEDSAHVLTAWTEALQTGYYQTECRLRHSLDGTYKWFLEQAVPLRDEKGKIQLWLGTYTDIDEQMQALERI